MTTTPTYGAKPAPKGAQLVPINLNSSLEHDILYKQRVICGWKQDHVSEWREQIEQKRRSMFWIVLPGDLSAFPEYASVEGADDLPRIRRRKVEDGVDGGDEARDANGEGSEAREAELLPVGHISLDREDLAGEVFEDRDSGLTEPDGSVLTITTLFVLPAFRSFGLASYAFQSLCDWARDPKYGSANCRAVTLDTLASPSESNPAIMKAWTDAGFDANQWPRSNIPWYERLGFRRYMDDRPRYTDKGIKFWATYMRKELV